MSRSIITAILVLGCALIANDFLYGHGGQYRGPGGGTPPPPNLGGADGGSSQSSNASSGSAGPAAPPLSTPTATSGRARARGGSAGGLQGKRWSGGQGYERWEFWWEYNKDNYLDLKNKLFNTHAVKGSSSYLIGRRSKDQFRTSRLASAEIITRKVLPLLGEALDMEHPDIQDSSILAIARVTDPRHAQGVLDQIKLLLSSRFQSAQQAACLSLGVLGSREAIPLCIDLMMDTPAGRKVIGKSEVPVMTRSFAAISLGLIGAEEAMPHLQRVIDDESQMTGKDLVSCAITALGLIHYQDKGAEAVDYLCRKLAEENMDAFLRSNIPVALGRIGDPAAIPALTRMLRDKRQDKWISRSCVIALGRLADLAQNPDIPDLLISCIEDNRDVHVKHLAFIALAQIGARDSEYAVHGEQHKRITRFFQQEIRKPSRHSHPPWASLAASIHAMPHPVIQKNVIDTICKKFRDSKNPSHKGALAIGLGLLSAEGFAEELYHNLCLSTDKMLQGYLCVGLGLMRWTGAVEKLRTFALSERSPFLRLQASVGLGLMGDEQAPGVLVRALEEGHTLNVISSVARALGQIGDAGSVDPLKEIVEDTASSSQSKAFAIVALGIIGEKTNLPWNSCISENCNYTASTLALVEILDIL